MARKLVPTFYLDGNKLFQQAIDAIVYGEYIYGGRENPLIRTVYLSEPAGKMMLSYEEEMAWCVPRSRQSVLS
jgi:hypothetical protein